MQVIPSNFFLSVKIPDLFSFPITTIRDEDLSKKISSFIQKKKLLNKMAANQLKIVEKAVLEHNILNLLESFDRCELNAPNHKAKEHAFRINTALCVIFNNYGISFFEYHYPFAYSYTRIIQINSHFLLERSAQLFQSLEQKSEEIWWYYACVLASRAFSKSEFTPVLIDNTILCIENIKSLSHRRALYKFIINDYYPRISDYPQYEPLQKLESLFREYSWKLDAVCAKLRHTYVLRQIKNKTYFDVYSSDLLSDSSSSQKELEFDSFGKGIKIQVCLSKQKLFRFSAHINSPSPMILKISMPDIDKAGLKEEFNSYLKKNLNSTNNCNTLGF